LDNSNKNSRSIFNSNTSNEDKKEEKVHTQIPLVSPVVPLEPSPHNYGYVPPLQPAIPTDYQNPMTEDPRNHMMAFMDHFQNEGNFNGFMGFGYKRGCRRGKGRFNQNHHSHHHNAYYGEDNQNRDFSDGSSDNEQRNRHKKFKKPRKDKEEYQEEQSKSEYFQQ